MRSQAQRLADKSPRLPKTHRLERARNAIEHSIVKYQALLILEESSPEHKSIPIPRILSGEASAMIALADILRLQSSLCLDRTSRRSLTPKGQVYLSARGETSTKLYELASQNCDAAAAMAGVLGDTAVEARAMRAIADLAHSRCVNNVATHRLQRGIDLLHLLSSVERAKNGGKIQRSLDRMCQQKRDRLQAKTTTHDHLLALRKRLGQSVAVKEEANITRMFLKVVQQRDPLPGCLPEKNPSNWMHHTLNLTGLFELFTEMGTSPALSEEELIEAMQQIVGGSVHVQITEKTEVGLDELVVWWLDGV